MIHQRAYDESQFETILRFCEGQADLSLPSLNLWDGGWENKPHTLPYILKNTAQFSDNGQLSMVFDDDILIAVGGVYVSDFSKDVALAGVRTWVDKKYRNQQIIRNFVLPANKQWVRQRQVPVIALTFNEYNKNLIKLFSAGQKRYTRQLHNIFAENFNVVDFPVIIRNTIQWVIYEQLGSTDFSWVTIKSS